MEVGGRQGSENTGRLFSKMMDRLAERLLNISIGFQLTTYIRIPVLLWVDDVTCCMVGKEDQRTILQQVNQFGKDHKLKWGKDKCQVMRVGKHNKNNKETWKIGEMEIGETTTYKYLGDTVTNDGRNRKNLELRKNPAKELMNCNKEETKTIIISRYGMLECGKNFKGTKNLECNESSAVDDESHRLNSCIKYSD